MATDYGLDGPGSNPGGDEIFRPSTPVGVVSVLQAEASACNTDTTPTQPHRNSNTHRTKNSTTNVVIQQHSRKLLMIDIFSLQHGYHSNPTTPKLQHTSNQEQYDQCGNSTAQSQAPDDRYIKPAKRIPLQPNHTETPSHIEPRTIRPMW